MIIIITIIIILIIIIIIISTYRLSGRAEWLKVRAYRPSAVRSVLPD